MLSKELCIKLKEAGFQLPQPHPRADVVSVYYTGNGERIIEPSLSALIEACGDCFVNLAFNHKINHRLWTGDLRKWGAWGFPKNSSVVVETFGDTPEEAVAHLWLNLPRVTENENGTTYWNGTITGKLNKK